MRVLLSPADHVIVVVPNYQAAETLPLDICATTGVPLLEDAGWRLDLDAMVKAIRPNTKLVSINFPNNPTGAIPSLEEFRALVDLCRRHGLYLFSDEVYRLLELDDAKRIPQAADVYEKGLSLNVMSKAYGLSGLRIGWIASHDAAALDAFHRYKHYWSICNSAPSERLAKIALLARHRILERNRNIVRQNLAVLDEFFADYREIFDWRRPDGGCVAYPRFLGRGGVEALSRNLVEESGALLLPAAIYRSELLETSPNRFRIGCGRRNLDAGLTAFRAFLERHYDELRP
jgi:aspartate/methionine/tyrosine aminotransferase